MQHPRAWMPIPEFSRESGEWLFAQPFWLEMSQSEQQCWLEFREGVALEHEDPLEVRKWERMSMEQEDVVGLSYLDWDPDDEWLVQVERQWAALGGGPVVLRRLRLTAPRTPPTRPRSASESTASDKHERLAIRSLGAL